MSVIRRGITRTVILTRRYAIKVPSLRGGSGGYRGWFVGAMWSATRGIQANISESEWSRDANDPGLCPVLWTLLGIINVYPRCQPVADDAADIDYMAIAKWLPASDKKPDNVGWLDGRLVWIDYDMSWNDCSCGRRELADETT